jgi:hypothetical protein
VAVVHISGMAYYPEGKAFCPHCGKESITEKINMKNIE